MNFGILKNWHGSAFATLLLLAATAGTQAQELKKFVIGWPSNFNLTIAHMEYGRQLGFFKAEKIDLEIISVPSGSYTTLQQLLAGTLHVSLVGVEAPIVAQQPGKPTLPIRVIYNYLRDSIWEIVVKGDSPIKSIAELKGKKIGVPAMAWGSLVSIRAILSAEGINENDFSFVAVGLGAGAKRALTTGDVDALALFDIAHEQINDSSVKLRRLQYPEQFRNMPSHGLAVTETMLKNEPDLVARFGRAMTKSIIACNENPEDCVKAFWATYPAFKSTAGTDAEILQRDIAVLATRNAKMSAFRPDEPRHFGAFSDKDWDQVIRALKVGGLIEKTDIDRSKVYTNQFVKAYNDFDVKAVIAAAKKK